MNFSLFFFIIFIFRAKSQSGKLVRKGNVQSHTSLLLFYLSGTYISKRGRFSFWLLHSTRAWRILLSAINYI